MLSVAITRLRPDDGHHGRHALHRLRDPGLTGGVGAVVIARARGGQVRVLSRGRAAGVASLHRRLDHHDARLDPAAGRVPARHLGQGREDRGARLGARRLDLFLFAFVPMFLAYSATLIDPKMFGELLEKDSQLVLPTLILQHTPLVRPGGVLRRAALGHHELLRARRCSRPRWRFPRTSSAALLPRMTRPRVPADACASCSCASPAWCSLFALNSEATIFKMVENAYKVTLVSPSSRCSWASTGSAPRRQGALAGIVAGLVDLAAARVLRRQRRRRVAAAARRLPRGRRRHGRRLARAAAVRPRTAPARPGRSRAQPPSPHSIRSVLHAAMPVVQGSGVRAARLQHRDLPGRPARSAKRWIRSPG